MAGIRAAGLIALLIGSLGLCSSVIADPVVRGEEHCVVNVGPGDALNIRARPVANAQVVARKRHDECSMLVNGPCKASWCPVEDGHALGWAHRRFLAMVSPAIYCVAGVALGDTLNLRRYPSSQSRVIRQLNRRQCDIAFLPYAVGNWQKIRVDGWQGWAHRRYLSGQ